MVSSFSRKVMSLASPGLRHSSSCRTPDPPSVSQSTKYFDTWHYKADGWARSSKTLLVSTRLTTFIQRFRRFIFAKHPLEEQVNKNIVLWSRKCPQLSSPGWRWCLWTSPPPGHRWSCCWNTGPAPTEKHRWQTPMWRQTVLSDFTDTYLVVSHGSSHLSGESEGDKKIKKLVRAALAQQQPSG